MSEPTLHDILHILRNPYGWSQEAIRAAQLAACDLLEAAAPVPAREWIPVGERLPKQNCDVLVYSAKDGIWIDSFGSDDHGSPTWQWAAEKTHWMPLPSRPNIP